MSVVLVHGSPNREDIALRLVCPDDLAATYTWATPLDAQQDASEVLGVLLRLPTETRRELQRLLIEHADTFAGVPYSKGAARKAEPVKGFKARRR